VHFAIDNYERSIRYHDFLLGVPFFFLLYQQIYIPR